MNDLPRESSPGRRVHNERSMGLRQRRIAAFEVLAVVAGVSFVLGCGDDKPARDQAVLWLQMSTGNGQQCSSAASFNLPDDSARSTILSGNIEGERLVDGEDDALVECTVTAGAAAGQYEVSVDLAGGAIANFSARGTVTKMPNVDGTGTFDIDFASTFSLAQTGCTATVGEALGGALWVRNLSCPALRDPSSPSIECTGTGGFIVENCSRR
jgi:hypothetical protein